MSNPRINLIIGIISISIFPVLVKWAPVSGITSAFYRMLLGLLFLFPYVLFRRKFTFPTGALWLPIVLCGIIFATDIAGMEPLHTLLQCNTSHPVDQPLARMGGRRNLFVFA